MTGSLLFQAPMAMALWKGQKTQTRRMLKPSSVTVLGSDWSRNKTAWSGLRMEEGVVRPWKGDEHLAVPWCHPADEPTASEDCGIYRLRPKFEIGSLIWVREACRAIELPTQPGGCADMVLYPACGTRIDIRNDPGAANDWINLFHYGGKRPKQQGWADGTVRGRVVPSIHMPRWASRMTLDVTRCWIERVQSITDADAVKEGCPGGAEEYRELWKKINGIGSWTSNPWIVAYEFVVHKLNIADVEVVS